MKWYDYVTLLATGLVAIYALWRFYNHYRESKSLADICYMVSFGVLLVAGLLLIAFTYDVLDNPLVVLVSYLIPAGLSLGLVVQFYPKYGMPYLIVVILGLALIGITRILELDELGRIVLPIFHTIAGLTIVLLPMLVVREGRAPTGFLGVSLGGVLIGLGGIALAFLKADNQFLFFTEEVVFAILAPLLLLMALAFTWGLVTDMLSEKEALPKAG
jgi:hypothetical protein